MVSWSDPKTYGMTAEWVAKLGRGVTGLVNGGQCQGLLGWDGGARLFSN